MAPLWVKGDIYSQTKLYLDHFGKECIVNHSRNSSMFNLHFVFDSTFGHKFSGVHSAKRGPLFWLEGRKHRVAEMNQRSIRLWRAILVGTLKHLDFIRFQKTQFIPQWKNFLQPLSLFNGMFLPSFVLCV